MQGMMLGMMERMHAMQETMQAMHQMMQSMHGQHAGGGMQGMHGSDPAAAMQGLQGAHAHGGAPAGQAGMGMSCMQDGPAAAGLPSATPAPPDPND
jgi:Tfp pilus assembly protein PilV